MLFYNILTFGNSLKPSFYKFKQKKYLVTKFSLDAIDHISCQICACKKLVIQHY